MENYQDISVWKNIPLEKWTDWHWQLQNVITSLDDLEKIIALSDEERKGVEAVTKFLKMRITPYIASFMLNNDSQNCFRKQFIPSVKELLSFDGDNLFQDVNADDQFSPIKGLVHRYPSKVLILPTNYCGAYCRYCFRRKFINEVEETLSREELNSIFTYLKNNPSINEAILSGGDPLVTNDEYLEYILENLSAIPSIKILRIHTRIPVSLPYRITPNLISILKKVKPIYIVIHIDTPFEISTEMKKVIDLLVDNGIPCLASIPLLKGINDNEMILSELLTQLVELRVKPYYLFHSDPLKGLKHFLVPLRRGTQIVYNLYDRISGLAMPQYCFNVPNGGGHVLINYNYIQNKSTNSYIITTFDGNKFEFIDEAEQDNY